MRPRDAIAPAPEVGVVVAPIADRPRQQAHPADLSLPPTESEAKPPGRSAVPARLGAAIHLLGEAVRAANCFAPSQHPHRRVFNSPFGAFDPASQQKRTTIMPHRRRVASKAIITQPNICIRISTWGIRIRNCGKSSPTHHSPTSTPTSWRVGCGRSTRH
jgi:hypothetical protein